MSEAGEQIKGLAKAVGMAVVEDDGAPVVAVLPDLNQTARLLGQVAARLDLFDRNGELVFIDHSGLVRGMNPATFRTWINDHVIIAQKFDKDNGKAIAGTLGIEDSRTVLASENFKRGVRKLTAVNAVRLPVVRDDGTLEALPHGYDEQTGAYTLPNGLDYDRSISVEAAKVGLDRMDAEFPFADDRSRAMQRAAMLSLFVKHLPGGQSMKPAFLWLANKPESGKSVLAKTAIYPVIGTAAAAKMKEGEQLDKEMEAFIRSQRPYIFLDNVYGGIQSATIDAMLTSKRSAFRGMGGHDDIEVDNVAQLLATGNRLELNEDGARRFAVVDLFEKGEPSERKVTERLDDEVMIDPVWRARLLSWMWAMVEHWHAQGMPKGKLRMGSFEVFTELLGGIVTAAGYEEPFQKVVIPDAVNPEKAEFGELLDLVIEEMGGEVERDFTLEELARLARSANLFMKQVGTQEEGRKLTIKEDGLKGEEKGFASDQGYLTPSQRSSWGKRIAKEAGGEPRSKSGKRVEFGRRSQARKVAFTIRLLD